MIYFGKTGDFWVYYDRVLVPVCVKSEQADDYVTDLANAIGMMHQMQDEMLEKGDEP